MKWNKKYNVDLDKIHNENLNGFSMVELSEKYNIPKTTLLRYMNEAGYEVLVNRKIVKSPYFITKTEHNVDYDFGYKNTFPWKKALIFKFGHKCFVCGYDKIVEAHHIVSTCNGGKTSIRNGILLCPNHHAEVHAEILSLTEALVKLEELLEYLIKDNQQPSYEGKAKQHKRAKPMVIEGSETKELAEAVISSRASRSSKRNTKQEYKEKYLPLLDKI